MPASPKKSLGGGCRCQVHSADTQWSPNCLHATAPLNSKSATCRSWRLANFGRRWRSPSLMAGLISKRFVPLRDQHLGTVSTATSSMGRRPGSPIPGCQMSLRCCAKPTRKQPPRIQEFRFCSSRKFRVSPWVATCRNLGTKVLRVVSSHSTIVLFLHRPCWAERKVKGSPR